MRIDVEAVLFQPLEIFPMRREHFLVSAKNIVGKHVEAAIRDNRGIEHSQCTGRTVARVGKGSLALHLKLVIDLFELLTRQKHLAADFGVYFPIELQSQRNRPDGPYI